MHELTEIMRQKDDLDFAQLLNRLRENILTENDYKILEKSKMYLKRKTFSSQPLKFHLL
jgi:hypothetical protein